MKQNARQFHPDGMHSNIGHLAEIAGLLLEAERVVCLTGAGVSADSGVPTFRDALTGLWSRFDPEQLASQAGFAAEPGLVWQWYMSRLDGVESALPNAGHEALAALEILVPDFLLVTQNVDDLHERAGSRDVVHLHGNLARYRCNRCRAEYSLSDEDRTAEYPPICQQCGTFVRPDVVWFGESLPHRAIERASHAALACDVMLVVGTSGVVYPAALLPRRAKESGAFIIDVNPVAGAIREFADRFLEGPSAEVLPLLIKAIQTKKTR